MKPFCFFAMNAVFALAFSTAVAEPVKFEIEAGEASSTLKLFSRQAKLQTLFDYDLVRNFKTRAVDGSLEPDIALSQMLEGTRLTFERINDRTVVIRSAVTNSSTDTPPAVRLTQIGTSAAPNSGAPAQATEAASPTQIQEIVVTAQKRGAERLQDVPASMVVLGADRLEALGMQQLSDYVKLVPGLQLLFNGGPGQGKAVIRGISSGGDAGAGVAGGGDRLPLVGLYLDDVPFTTSSAGLFAANLAFDPALADIEQIEVLKGPQSTLYGASNMGGLIKYVSKRPNLTEWEGSARVSGSQIDGGGSGSGVRLSANIPLVSEKVALRASAFYREGPGYVDNAFYNDKDVNGDTVHGGRFSLLIALTDKIDTTFSGFLQKTSVDGPYNVFYNPATGQPTLGSIAISSPFDQSSEFKYTLAGNTTSWTLPFATLTNNASHAEILSKDTTDVSALGFLGGASRAVAYGDKKSKRFSDELRLASLPGKIEWLVGGFYTHEDIRFGQNVIGMDANGVNVVVPAAAPIYNIRTYVMTGTFKESAVFGDVTYHFSPQWEATLGGRYSSSDQHFDLNSLGIIGSIAPSHPTSDSSTDYLVTFSYKPVTQFTAYARVASAYRLGGPNVIAANALATGVGADYKADQLVNYELGVKGSTSNGLFSYSAAVYHMDWSDIQVSVTYAAAVGGGNTVQFQAVANAGKAESDGVEAAINLNPLEGLQLALNASYNKAQLLNTTGLGASGQALPYTPKLISSATVDYRRPVFEQMTASAGLTFAYTDEQFNAVGAAARKVNPYGTLDLRAGLEWSQYSLIATANNVTNRFAFTSLANTSYYPGAALLGTILRPRNFGLAFEARF